MRKTTKGFNLNELCKTAHKIAQEVNTVSELIHCSVNVRETAKAYVKYVTERTNETKCLFVSGLADVVVCCMIIAAHEDIDIEKAIEDCVEKNRKRAEGMGGKK
jgi:NTP pyrophosphatase (non-canonical NTP hydrolase)